MPVRAISSKAVASIVLAALSWCLWPFAGIPAFVIGVASLVLAILGLWDIHRGQGRLKGRLLAVGGIVTQAVAMVVFLLLVPVREAAQRMMST
jgi:hypothetical protein